MSGTPPQAAHESALNLDELMRGRLAQTPALLALAGLNLAVFVAMLCYGAGLWHSPNAVQLAWGAGFGPATKDGEWWRLGSAMFLHFGLVHLAMNMWALWDGGRLVERLYGSWRFLAVYVASGLTGNIASLIAQGDKAVSGGASGAVFGIYGALMVCLWCARGQIAAVEFRWLFGGAVVFSAVTIVFGLLIPGIDNAAHAGGLVTGALAGLALLPPTRVSGARIAHGRMAAAGVYCIALIALVASIPAPKYSWKEEQRAREGIQHFLDDDRRIIERWQQILQAGKQGEASFDELAGLLDAEVTREYRESFEQLSALHLDPAAPSNMTLQMLKKYTELRADAAQALAEGLRNKNQAQIREALEMARRAPYLARGETPPPAR